MNDYIKTLIEANRDAVDNVAVLEDVIKDYPVTDEKSKTNFGNLCILLNGYRNVAKATDCLLINENVLKDANGNYYQKIEEEEEVPEEGKPANK
jgi:hypothetical protein